MAESSLLKKGISIFFLILILGNLVMFGFGKIAALPFWIIIGCCALVAYVLLPKVK